MNGAPTDAATVILLRSRSGTGEDDLEVLMVLRHRKSSFVPGYYVFPGGVIDPGDYEADAERFVRGLNREEATRVLNDMSRPEKALGAWVAAVRETFEEVGILLAENENGVPAAIQTDEERRRFSDYRRRLIERKIPFVQILRDEKLFLPLYRLHYFSHWITPEGFPLRYDVRFFVAECPAGQSVSHDGVELTKHVWLRPKDALEQYHQGRLDMVLPQVMTLQDIRSFKTPRQVMENARRRHISATLTKMLRLDGREVEVMPDGTVYENRPPVYPRPDEEDPEKNSS
jgi:8-oxo-dGTP pyrophosphatase MutT (NUDIX family)